MVNLGRRGNDRRPARARRPPRLNGLFLFRNASVTDESLGHVAGLTALEELDFCNTSVTDSGMAHIANLTALKRLWMFQTAVTDAGTIHLAGLGSLELLDLRWNNLSDNTLEDIKDLRSLVEARGNGHHRH